MILPYLFYFLFFKKHLCWQLKLWEGWEISNTFLFLWLLPFLGLFRGFKRVGWGGNWRRRGFSPFREGFILSGRYHVNDRREKNKKNISMECLLFTFSIFETWTKNVNLILQQHLWKKRDKKKRKQLCCWNIWLWMLNYLSISSPLGLLIGLKKNR